MRVRTITLLVVLFAGLLGLSYLTGMKRVRPDKKLANWETKIPVALGRAAKENKVVLVDFYADWCRWCKKLDAEVFSNADVIKALEAKVILVRLNAEKEGEEEAKQLQVKGYPTVVFMDANGKELKRIEGYLGSEDFLKEVQSLTPRSS